jgi:epoxide hydrolase 4
MPLHHHFADLNGITLHYVSAGPATGELILFLHGFPEFWYEWQAQLQEFGATHLAVAPDMRGYNLSSRPAAVEAYRSKHLVEDIRALAAHLKGEGTQFTLVAHDWGGAVAWAFALEHPQLLRRLIIINSPHPAVFLRELATNPKQAQASQYMRLFQAPEAEAICALNNYEFLATACLKERSAEEQAIYRTAWSQPGALTGGLNYYRAMRMLPPALDGEPLPAMAPSIEKSAFTVKVPTTVIWGEQDTALTVGNLEGLAEFVPDLQIHRVPDASHWVVAEKPALINQIIHQSLH